MDKKPSISKRKTGKPSKLLALCALILGCLLPYFLIKYFSHQKNEDYTSQAIALPELPDNDSSTVSDMDIDEEPEPPKEKVAQVKDNEWQIIYPRPGDSMATIFSRLGLSAKNLYAVLNKNPHAKALTNIKPSQRLQFLINKHQLEKLIIPVSVIEELTVYREGSKYKTKTNTQKTTTNNLYVTGTIKGSLYNTAKQLNISNKLVAQMTEILNKQIDFTHSIHPGDHFSMVYEAYYFNDKLIGIGDIQAVRYVSRGKTYEAIRHTSANGEHDYYSATGGSFKKAFSRYPIRFSHISSTFSTARQHPILHYKRAHKGIDLAAPIGTPILATADGIIETIGRHNGYGNMIKIKHAKPYSTIYGHMLRFQKGLSRGSRVKRGQVIGYVGQTGLATGPHCHYELHVNNVPRNPTTISLPSAGPVPAREMAAFKAKAHTFLAHLKLYESAKYAAKGKKNADVG